jgi:hypothetical protein
MFEMYPVLILKRRILSQRSDAELNGILATIFELIAGLPDGLFSNQKYQFG